MSLYCHYVNNPFSSWTLIICILTIIFYFAVFDSTASSPMVYYNGIRNFMLTVLVYTMGHCMVVIGYTSKCQVERIK